MDPFGNEDIMMIFDIGSGSFSSVSITGYELSMQIVSLVEVSKLRGYLLKCTITPLNLVVVISTEIAT